ncbi:MAG: phenylalanine--tRNA ligase subunit alpha, partial [Stellaceae bacterium]
MTQADTTESYARETAAEIDAAANLDDVEKIRVAALGRNGVITQWMKSLGTLPKDERAAAGARFNQLRAGIEEKLGAAAKKFEVAALAARLSTERVDITLPVKSEIAGRIHPISQTIAEVVAIFGEMGFRVAEGPHIEDDFHNFTALNIPP